MLLLVGLGNPGPRSAHNRHNVGFMAADAIVRAHPFGPYRKRFHGLVSEGFIAGIKVLVLKPQTYMNKSGRSVAEAARFYKLSLDRITVVHDEIDLQPGKVRTKVGGGNAGHNGLRSIDAHIGNGYHRIRIGVGRPPRGGDVIAYVLRDFAKADRTWIAKTLGAIAETVALLVEGDAPGFMTRVALLTRPPKPAAPGDKGAETTAPPAGTGPGNGDPGAGDPGAGGAGAGGAGSGGRGGTDDGV
jgi:PTH1 family peptidyl-tRNA hydrolase